jgi:divalent metal cation (Fe/Co/Zn/Cd) transporter
MRFAKTIKCIQSLQAYHAGDKLIVEVDIVCEKDMTLKDSHDLGESLQYVLESVPVVDRAFVHLDYESYVRHPVVFSAKLIESSEPHEPRVISI